MAGLMDYLQGMDSSGPGLPPGYLSGVPGSGLPPMPSGDAQTVAGPVVTPVSADAPLPGLSTAGAFEPPQPAGPAPAPAATGLLGAGAGREFNLQRQDPSIWKSMLVGALGGPHAVEALWNKASQEQQGNVLAALNAKMSGQTLQPVEGKEGLVRALTSELLDGRPTSKPLKMDEVVGFLTSGQVPGGARLLGDEKFMGKLKFWAETWNHAAAQEQALMLKGHEDRQAFGVKAAQSLGGRVAPSQVPAALAADMAYAGEFPEGMPLVPYDQAVGRFGQGRQTPGATGLLAMAGAPAGAGGMPASRPAETARDKLYPGQERPGAQVGSASAGGLPTLPNPASYGMPGKAAQEVYTLDTTAPAKARTRGMEENASQAAQTGGHIARRMADQQIPAGAWETYTDPQTGAEQKVWSGSAGRVDLGNKRVADQNVPHGKWVVTTNPDTGMQQEVWSGGATGVGLGRKPEDVGDLKATVAKKALNAAAQGQALDKVFNPAEKALWESAVKTSTADEFLKLLGLSTAAGGMPGPAAGAPSQASPGARLMQGTGLTPSAPVPAPVGQTQPGQAGPQEGQTASNSQTGERMIFKRGKWVKQ